MPKTTLDVFAMLLEEPPFTEHILRETRDFWDDDWDYDEMEALFDEVVAEMDALVAALTTAWGPPAFHGRSDDAGYPEWAFHDVIAYWPRQGRFAYVAVTHEDKELPIDLRLGVSDGTL